MLTEDQKKWIAHHSDDSKIKIIPFDSSSQEKFEKVKLVIQSKLGESIEVKHRGATGLGIFGQDEIDVYVPVPPETFNSFIIPLTELFGKPKSHYPLERARFVTFVDRKHVDVVLINKRCSGWLDHIKFRKYLKEYPEILRSYEQLKESCNGMSTREYYLRKVEFINDILSKIE